MTRFRFLLWLLWVVAAAWAVTTYRSLPDPGPLAWRNPVTTALMDARAREAKEKGRKAQRLQRWVSLSSVASHAVDSVVLSEDASFFHHEGIDTHELKRALEEALRKGGLGRGASTITQQVAKNLWLSGDRSLLRKLKEVVLAKRLEAKLGKRRILTLYLNIAEWGDGIYGIQSAAGVYFNVSAADLSIGQGAILAAMLPSPRKWTPMAHPPVLRRRALHIVSLLEQVRRISGPQAVGARAEIDALLLSSPSSTAQQDKGAEDVETEPAELPDDD